MKINCINLTDNQSRMVRAIARREGESISQTVRNLVDRYIHDLWDSYKLFELQQDDLIKVLEVLR